MIDAFVDRLFSPQNAFANPVTLWGTVGLGVVLASAPACIALVGRARRLDKTVMRELYARHMTWLILIPMLLAPALIGPGAIILVIGVLSLSCYAEFARATGLFRWRLVSLFVVIGILLTTFAVYDHWYGLFVALPSLILIGIALSAMWGVEPRGYLQRLALGTLAYLFFGVCLGHLGFMANDDHYRPLLITLMLCVECNDIFAYIVGRTLGRRKLAPRISPNKTVAGAVGAIILTTSLFFVVGRFAFAGQIIGGPIHLLMMGLIITVGGQLGDLVVSALKRDLNLKDMSNLLPGHGGLLDRFDSTLLVAPAIFHYIVYFQGVGLHQPTRLLTGS